MAIDLAMFAGLMAIVGAVFCYSMAGFKQRDLASWFLLGALAPLPAAIAICLLPRLDDFGRPVR